MAAINIGDKFRMLTVLSKNGKNKHGKIRWDCKCDCGNLITVTGVYLRNGDTNSCGCYGQSQRVKSRIKHGQSHLNITAEYGIWKAMKYRCYNPKGSNFKNYGGRGITICERWKDNFGNFFEDMGKRPSDKHSIDRFPNINGNYEPTNCRWATDGEQSRGKRNNVWLEYNGKKMIMEDWAKSFNVHQTTLLEHLKTKSFEDICAFYDKKLIKAKIIEKTKNNNE